MPPPLLDSVGPTECIRVLRVLGCCPRSLLRPLLPGHTGGCSSRSRLSISARPRGQLEGPSGAFTSAGFSRNSFLGHALYQDKPLMGHALYQDTPSVWTRPLLGHTLQPSSPFFPSAHCPPAYPSPTRGSPSPLKNKGRREVALPFPSGMPPLRGAPCLGCVCVLRCF